MSTYEFNYQLLGIRENLTYYAKSLTASIADADDLFQETYLKALSNKDKFDPATNLKAWAYTIMRNTFINKYRKMKRQNTILDNTQDLFYINNSKSTPSATPESTLSFKEIRSEIEQLDDAHRIPFEMHYNGYKYKEIAEQLQLTIGTVKSRIFFSRKKLMEKLNAYQN